jgi:RimJ/RimL family protein N-acetyltransferase
MAGHRKSFVAMSAKTEVKIAAQSALNSMGNVEVNHLGQPVGAIVPGWVEPPRPARAPLEGAYCQVEPLSADCHGAQLHEANRRDVDGRSWTYLPYGPFATFEEYFAWLQVQAASSDPMLFAIVDLALNQATGVAAYLRIDPEAGSVEVGHLNFSPLLQKQRAATEAMFLMMRNAFELGYRRYEWKCHALNGPSRRAALRFGFSFEGLFRQARLVKGRNRDTAWFSILDRDWPRLKAAFEHWLDPRNFDDDGKQKESLSSLTRPIARDVVTEAS